MCGRFTLRTPAHIIAHVFNLSLQTEWQSALRYNISPTQEVPIVRQTETGRELTLARWGLIPSWASDVKIGTSMINARSETAAVKPAFRTAIKKRRCLIPADGFFEWQKEGKTKKPVYIRLREDGVFAFAGLWERWHNLESCSILTTIANELVKPLHERMPVILSPVDFSTWLNPALTDVSKLDYLFTPFPASELTAYQVNPIVNSSRNDVPECIEAVTP